MKDPDPRKLLPWFGSNTKLAPVVGKMFGRLRWCGVPFLGGGSELKFLDAKTGVANDLHSQVINLFNVVRDPEQREALIQQMISRVYHVEEFRSAQARCKNMEFKFADAVESAADYFVSAWMGRKGQAGTKNEFNNSFAFRWTCEGGDPVKEYHNARNALRYWSSVFQPWAFTCMDALRFIDWVKDHPDHGLYIDAPWPGAGDAYTHQYTENHQYALAAALTTFEETKIVVRFGDTPFIRKLYPEGLWKWNMHESRTQGNQKLPEALLTNFDWSPE